MEGRGSACRAAWWPLSHQNLNPQKSPRWVSRYVICKCYYARQQMKNLQEVQMAINIQNEQLLSLKDAAKVLPPVDGKRPHISTMWRWCRRGLRGIRLEYVRLGHRVCTSAAALSRFTNNLAAADESAPSTQVVNSPHTNRPCPRARERAIQEAEAVLARDGI
ncbi:MAG: DUF1580 domain-containing protein [Planctomycetota bacterium]